MPGGVPAAQIAPPLPGLAAQPVSHVRGPGEDQTRAASSPGTHAEHAALPGTRKPSAATSELHAQAAPQARGSGMAVRTRHASRSAAGRAHTTPAALAREFPEILRSHQAPPRQQIGTHSPRSPPGTPDAASRGTRVRARAPGSVLHAKPEWAPRGPCPWPSVKKPTVRTDCPGGPDAVRYTSVDTATHRLTVTHRDTRRDKKGTARRTAFPQPSGPFSQVVAGVGFEPT